MTSSWVLASCGFSRPGLPEGASTRQRSIPAAAKSPLNCELSGALNAGRIQVPGTAASTNRYGGRDIVDSHIKPVAPEVTSIPFNRAAVRLSAASWGA